MNNDRRENGNFDTVWEDDIYSKGKALNKYPYGELVSVFFQSLKYLSEPGAGDKRKVLEIGCGGGNNLWFMAELGFEVSGIDGSHTAVEAAENLFGMRGVKGDFRQAYFENLPYDDAVFDIVIDRGGTVCCDFAGIKRAWEEGCRVLKSGGVFIAFMLNENHPLFRSAVNGDDVAEYKDGGRTLRKIRVGDLSGLSSVSFIKYEDIAEIFSFGEVLEVREHRSVWVKPEEKAGRNGYSEYIIIGRKV
jgi:SAM-dependent methyltransferase